MGTKAAVPEDETKMTRHAVMPPRKPLFATTLKPRSTGPSAGASAGLSAMATAITTTITAIKRETHPTAAVRELYQYRRSDKGKDGALTSPTDLRESRRHGCESAEDEADECEPLSGRAEVS